jgi:hypothetical protein|tara:strand:+ start:11579 stop:14920 length:3342 start_codon:yes stop_codon:yes gene_type:complete
MANRFPLVVDTTAGNQFRELPDGDNLLLTNSSIVNALDIQALGTVTASQLIVDGTVFRNDYNDLQNKPTIPTSILQLGIGDGTNGQFLTTNGAGTISFQNIPVQDPVLGGDLSGTSSAATINPNTIGITEIDVDDGTIGQVLATDGSGNLQFIDMTGGGGGGGASNFLELSGQIGLSQIDDDFITPVKLKDNGQVPTAGQYLTVAAGGDFEYLDIPTTNPQWDDVQNKPAIPATLTDLGIVEGNDGDILKTDGAGNYTFTAFDSIENIEFSGTTIRTVPDNSNISIDPKGNGYLSIIGTNAVILPAGDTAQRTPNVAGAMRLNTQLGIFEGYDGSNWNGLGGVRSVDGLTYVSAESTPGASDDTITFVTNGQTSATLTETKLELNQAVGLKIKSTETALDFETGALSVDGGVSIKGNLIVSGAISVNEEFNTSVKVDGTTLSGSQTNQFSIGASDIDYFATSMKVRLFGASADDIDQDQTNLGVQVSRVGFGTPDGSGNEVTFSYRVAQMDQVSGKISAVTAAADITIEPEEITDFNNNKNIQVVVSRVSSSHNILVYRKVGSEVDYTLHSVLGPKELGVALSNIVFTDYYDFDVTPWSKRTNQGLFTTDSGLVHVPLTAPGSPKLGWFDTEITNINTDTNTLTVANQYYATSNSIEVVVDDTVAVQTAIDAAKAQNRNLLTLENRTYFIKRLELPDGFTLKGGGDQTRIIKQYWSTEQATGDNAIIRPKPGYASYSNITVRDVRIDGNAQNQYLTSDTTDNYLNYAVYLYGNDLLFENMELDNLVGGGIYAYDASITNNLTVLNSEITGGGLSYSFDWYPLFADECRTVKIAHNTFRDFPGPVRISAVQKGIVSPNIVDNCGEGIFAYGATKIVLTPNVLLGPAGEFIANPDVLNSEYDSVNILLENGIDFNSPQYVYQENGAFFDFTANQGRLTGLINELTKTNNVEELSTDYSETLSGDDYIQFTNGGDVNGNFAFRVVASRVNDLLSRASYTQLVNANANSQGLVYRIVATEYVPQQTINGNGNQLAGSHYEVPLTDVSGLNLEDVVRLVGHSTTPPTGGVDGTIKTINTISNTIGIDFGNAFGDITVVGNAGQVALQNNFVVAKGKIN